VAQKVQMVDDIDATPADGTVRFGLDGVEYEIDLSAANNEQLRRELQRYIGAARGVRGDTQGQSHLEAAYQVLSDRISDNFDLQWRGPTFALTAQSFLLLGYLQAISYHYIRVMLAALLVIVGIAAALLMARVQCLISIDQKLLDKYGNDLLGGSSEYLLRHAARIKERATGAEYNIPWRAKLLLRTPTPTMLWIITLLALSAAGIYMLLWTLLPQYIP